MTMTAFKDSQKGGAGAYTSNKIGGSEACTEDPATNPKPKPQGMAKLQSIAKDLDVKEGCSAPIVSSAGGYRPVTRGGGRRYEPL
jgi:hypothetical protein